MSKIEIGNANNFVYIPDGQANMFLMKLAGKLRSLLSEGPNRKFVSKESIGGQFPSFPSGDGKPGWVQPLKWDNTGKESYQPKSSDYSECTIIDESQLNYLNQIFGRNDVTTPPSNLNDRIKYLCNGEYNIYPDGVFTHKDGSLKVQNKRSKVKIPWVMVNGMIIPVNPFVGGGLEIVTGTDDLDTLITSILDVPEGPRGPSVVNNGIGRYTGHWGANLAVDGVIRCGKGADTKLIGIHGPFGRGATMVGGMLETAGGFFGLTKELIEEGRLFPEDLQLTMPNQEMPKLFQKKYLCTPEYLAEGEDYVKAAVEAAKATNSKVDETDVAFKAIIAENSILFQLADNTAKRGHGAKLQIGDMKSLNAAVNGDGVSEKDIEIAFEFANNYPINHLAFGMSLMENDNRNTAFSFMTSHGLLIDISDTQFEILKKTKSQLVTGESDGLVAIKVSELSNPTDPVTNLFSPSEKKVNVWGTHVHHLKAIDKSSSASGAVIAGIKAQLGMIGGKPKRKQTKKKSKSKKSQKKSQRKRGGGKKNKRSQKEKNKHSHKQKK